MKEDTYEHITEKRRRYHTGFGRFQTAVKSADLSGGKDRCGQCGGVCPSDPDPKSGEHGEGDPCPGQQCWWGDQLMIYDAIQGSRAPVELYCIGHAYSMAAVIVACGSHGRYILPHGEMMIHEPMLGQQVAGNSSSIRSISEGLLEMKGRINRLLAKHTKRSEEEIEKATAYDHFFSPEESVEFGLCDEIVGFEKILEPIL